MTRQDALPALEAATIRPVSEGGLYRVDNGILQRSVVTDGNAESRTSRTCHLRLTKDDDVVVPVAVDPDCPDGN